MNANFKLKLAVESTEGGWVVVVNAPGIEVDRIGPMEWNAAEAFIEGALTFAPSFVERRSGRGSILG